MSTEAPAAPEVAANETAAAPVVEEKKETVAEAVVEEKKEEPVTPVAEAATEVPVEKTEWSEDYYHLQFIIGEWWGYCIMAFVFLFVYYH